MKFSIQQLQGQCGNQRRTAWATKDNDVIYVISQEVAGKVCKVWVVTTVMPLIA